MARFSAANTFDCVFRVNLDKEVGYPPIRTDGAGQAAELIARLL